MTAHKRQSEYDEEYFSERYLQIMNNPYNLTYLDYAGTADFANPNGKKILDVGCGIGTLSWRLSRDALFVVATDISVYAIRLAKRYYSNPNLQFIIASGDFIPIKDEIVDCAVCSHLFEHLSTSEAQQVQTEIWRVLKRNGCIVVDQPFDAESISTLSLVTTTLYKALSCAKDNKEIDTTHKRQYDITMLLNELSELYDVRDFRLHQIWSPLIRALLILLRVREPDNWYVKFYLRSHPLLRRSFLLTPLPKIKAFKHSYL